MQDVREQQSSEEYFSPCFSSNRSWRTKGWTTTSNWAGRSSRMEKSFTRKRRRPRRREEMSCNVVSIHSGPRIPFSSSSSFSSSSQSMVERTKSTKVQTIFYKVPCFHLIVLSAFTERHRSVSFSVYILIKRVLTRFFLKGWCSTQNYLLLKNPFLL